MANIEAGDGSLHFISRDAANQTDYLKTCCDLIRDPSETIQLFNETTPEEIQQLIAFLEMAKDRPSIHIRRPLVGQGDLVASGMPDWALQWLNGLFEDRTPEAGWNLVFALANIADFVNCVDMAKVLMAKVASRICAMDQVSKRSIFVPSRPLTEEDKQKIRDEHSWAEMDPPDED